MSHASAFAISAAGMNLERTRIEVAALNLANANTVQPEGEPGFQPMKVLARSVPSGPGFAAQVESGLELLEDALPGLPLPEVSLVPAGNGAKRVHEPGNPFADSKGFVTYPGVDTTSEMMSMMSALRAYEANVVAMNTSKTLALKALEIGGNS